MSKKEKMKCDKIKELLSDYINGNLSTAERFIVARHLELCATCRKEQIKLEKLRCILSDFPEFEPPQGFAQRVIAKYYARKQKVSLLRKFFLGGLQPARAFAYGAVALFLVIAIALLSMLPRWTKASQLLYPLPTPSLKKAPYIISARGVGKVLVLPQSIYPNLSGQLRLEIMVYPPHPEERVWLNVVLSQGLTFANGNPFLPRQKDFFIGRMENPVAFTADIQILSNGVHWIKVSCVSNNIKWAEGLLFLPVGLPTSKYVYFSQSDVDAISLLSFVAERTGKPIALTVPISGRVSFTYQGEPEGAIHHYASLLGLTAIKYNCGFILEIP